eukprot:Amastigsp_a843731_23.p6 type:complete len:108 gc:universal Amastigsp_a843731_23:2005-2328(+)
MGMNFDVAALTTSWATMPPKIEVMGESSARAWKASKRTRRSSISSGAGRFELSSRASARTSAACASALRSGRAPMCWTWNAWRAQKARWSCAGRPNLPKSLSRNSPG